LLHIDLPTRVEIEKLAAHRQSPAVSIYLRTTPLTQDTDANRIELKNQLKAAVAEMTDAGIDKRSIWPIEESVGALIEDDDFWAYQANSLAIFVTPEKIQTFRLANKLTSMVEVADRFHLKPLIRAVTFPHNAYVLAIGIGAVRFIEVSADLPPHEVKVPNRATPTRPLAGAAIWSAPATCVRARPPARTRCSPVTPAPWTRRCVPSSPVTAGR
jgi:hypothetical protein